ncbi:hypothetical protein GGX14DRAFT_400561 [Mycena pura]|uniref:Uncharacterized protein n=1 Tax=Mycena pura TaxID=153505 RepID=A0AAD6Y9D2_9AGAR|nr:hypothetical protein GGX14DRAFT_400561 [Mycena pura]
MCYLYTNCVKDSEILVDTKISLTTMLGDQGKYVLRAAIYWGSDHYTVRIIEDNGNLWYHDAIETGPHAIGEGNLQDTDRKFLNSIERPNGSKMIVGVIYCRQEEQVN